MINLEELRSALKQLKKKTGTFADIGHSDIGQATGPISFGGQQSTDFRLENRTSDPENPTVGQIWLRTDI